MATTNMMKEVAWLRAYRVDGALVEEAEISLADYYQGLHDLIDQDDYRAARNITIVEGQLYDHNGKLEQTFRNRYSERGEYVGGRTVFADGTVNED